MPDYPVLKNKNIYIIFGITLFGVMGVASITPALPSIAEHFNLDYKKIGLLITVFTLPGIFLTPVLGVLADRFGRKTILVPSLFLFAIAGFSCSQTDSFRVLLWFRFFQGIGAASLGSLNITLIGDIFEDSQRPTAMGFNASVLSIGTAMYPLVGGSLTLLGWNAPFFFPVMAIPAGLMVLFVLDTPKIHKEDKFLEYLSQTFRSIAQKKVLGLFSLNVLTFIILYGSYLTYFPIILKHNFDSGPFLIGVILSSSSFSTAITSSFLGKLSKKFGHNTLLKVSYLVYATALVLIPFLHSEILLLIPALLFGFAQGINIPNIQTMLVQLAPINYRGAFMSLNGMVLRLGQTMGPMVAAWFYSMGGINLAFLGGSAIAGIMILLVFSLIQE